MNGNNVLNDIKNERNEMFQKIVKELRNQNALNDNNDIIIMLNENLKKVKEQYLKDIEKSEQNHLDEVKELKEKNMLLKNKLNGLDNKLSYKDIQLIDIQKKIDEINITYKNLENKNTLLLDENNFLKKEKNDLRYSLEDLKDLLEKREEEFLYEKKKYEFTIKKLNEEINNYQDMLSNKEKEKSELKKNYDDIIAEKKELSEKIDKFIQDENELNLDVDDKHDKKIMKKYIKNRYIIEKDEEINSLNKYIDKIKKEYFEAIDKKKYYKSQCKIVNDKLDIIKNVLTPQQIERIQNEIKSKGLN
jgi:chromosome segregation ATPase